MEMEQKKLIKSLDDNLNEEKNEEKKISLTLFFSYLGLAIFIGILTGFLLTKLPFKLESIGNKKITKNEDVVKRSAGLMDKKVFKDVAEGILKEGGIDGEGNFHLERPGGPSQNVYLTSSTVDLSLYVDKKVRVYGQTFAAQKAGWLMDVGYIEVLE